jgi:predicted dehydrogenase
MRDDALLDLAPHLVDLARWLTRSEIVRVRTHTLTPLRAVFEIELAQGRAAIHCAADRVFSERVEIRDGRRRVVARYRRGGLARAVLDRLRPQTESALVSTLTRQLEAFGRWVRDGAETPLASSADGVAVMATLDAVRRSGAASDWCPVTGPEADR